METNLELIIRYVGGDNEALGVLFHKREYWEMCFFTARKILYTGAAKDAASETLVVMLKKSILERATIFAQGGGTEAGFKGYNMQITRNIAIDMFNKDRGPKEPDITPDEFVEPEHLFSGHSSEVFFERMEKLKPCEEEMKRKEIDNPEKRRTPLDSEFLDLWLSVGTGDYAPFMEEFGLDKDTIRKTMQRIMIRLQRCIGIDAPKKTNKTSPI